jgi:hypothetical protein
MVYFLPSILFGQDILVLKNSDEIKSKIVEITDLTIKYKKWENLNGPIYNITKLDVLFIRYENGMKEVISPTISMSNPEIVNNQVEPEVEEIDLQDSKIRMKRMVRLSWDIANLEFIDETFSDFGIGEIGYNSRLDIGLNVFQRSDFELGFNITPFNLGIHQGSSGITP